jgi:hypothetical protein
MLALSLAKPQHCAVFGLEHDNTRHYLKIANLHDLILF